MSINTGWVAKCYNGRGLVVHNIGTRNLVRTSDGVLWAAIRENIQSKYIRIYRSINNGFSWDLMWAGNFTTPGTRSNAIAALNVNGPIMNLVVDEKRNRLTLFHSFFNGVNNKYQVEPFTFKLTNDNFLTRIDPAPGTPSSYNTVNQNIDMDQTIHVISHNEDFFWLSHLQFSALKLMIGRVDEPIVTEYVADLAGTDFFNIHATCCTDTNDLDLIIVEDRTANYGILHFRFSKISQSWTTGHLISEFPKANVHDICLERDGRGTMCAMWTQYITDGTDLTVYYVLSTDNGLTWTSPTPIPKTFGHANYIDAATQQLATRNNLIGINEGGFVLTYVRSFNSTPMCYWRRLTYTGSSTAYTLDPELELASNTTGAKFFRPTSTNLVNGLEAINLRVGYTIGEGDSTTQTDNRPVALAQKTLDEGMALVTDAYNEEAPAENQLPISFNILGAPNANVDYYAQGLIGNTTNKYISAFEKIGTRIRLYRYEPNPDSYLSDRSAYFEGVEYGSKAVFNAVNYNMPVNQSLELFESYMERDTRIIYLPPTFHLARTFTLNKGQYLKRTVWTVAFDGNTYELSQVIPFFLADQIAYYTSNAYVIGASNDPYSRVILPSET